MLVERLNRAIALVSEAMAVLAGLMFLLLSFYITLDVAGRYTGWFHTRVADDIAAYTLAVGGTWAMAHALRVGGHVQIDVLIGRLRRGLRETLMLAVTAVTAVFAGLLAVYGWQLALDSWARGIVSITILQAPLFIPQSLVAVGFSMLALEAILILAHGIVRRLATAGGAID